MDKLKQGGLYTGIVESYTREGYGIVRIDGAVVFVPYAVRGECIQLRITKVMKRAAVGEIVKILKISSQRQLPNCPYFTRCGGCDFQHLSYEEELYAKYQQVQDALSRLGGSDVKIEKIIGAKHSRCYRNKSQYAVGKDGTIGFYEARSHRVVSVEDCLIQPKNANCTVEAVREWMRRYHISTYDETTEKGLIRHIYVRINHVGESLCCIVANGRKLPREPELVGIIRAAVPETIGIILNRNTKRTNVILGEQYRIIWGQDFLFDSLCGLTFKLSLPSFYQVNREQAEKLYQKVLEFAELTGQETVLDLYCGVGTITLCIARNAKEVIGAEIIAKAVKDAQENAARNHITNTRFECADASEIAQRLEHEGLHPDVITVDPPRKGLTEDVIRAIVAMRPTRVIYVSCDPGTLGRDIKYFKNYGYNAIRAIAVDMFPATRHIESVVKLTRAEL